MDTSGTQQVGGGGGNNTTDPWASDFQTPPDPGVVKTIDKEIAKFDPTPGTPLSVADLYGASGSGGKGVVGGKERVEVYGGGGASELSVPVEASGTVTKEMERATEVEGVEVEEKEHAVLSESVKDDKTGEVLVENAVDEAPQIEVPIERGKYMAGLSLSPAFSLRWLYEVIRLLALKGYRVVFRD